MPSLALLDVSVANVDDIRVTPRRAKFVPFAVVYRTILLYNLVHYIPLKKYRWYAGIAVPQVLQYIREFDALAMQSCKPLLCGIGSSQNRRLREQTLNRKTCHCGSIKGGWCMELPTSLDQPLQG